MLLLHVDSSILGDHSVSRTLTKEIVDAEVGRNPSLRVVYRDLAAEPLAHISGAHLAVMQGKQVDLPASVQQEVVRGTQALEEFLASDIVVVGAPMYNFTVPTQLKAWIDRLAVAGTTFRYGPKGPEGLAGGKRVIIASARGGAYGPGTPRAFLDHQETYLRAVFGFVGIDQIVVIRAEGLSVADNRNKSLEAARADITKLV